MNQEIHQLHHKINNQKKNNKKEKELDSKQVNALKALHSVLYMVEAEFTDF